MKDSFMFLTWIHVKVIIRSYLQNRCFLDELTNSSTCIAMECLHVLLQCFCEMNHRWCSMGIAEDFI